MKTIGIVTVGRSDYGIYLPLINRIQAAPDLHARLFVAGMHLSPEFGKTCTVIENDGFPIAARVEMSLSSDTPEGIAKSMGLGVIGFAQKFSEERPDILVLLGDRFEMFAAGVAALPFNIPMAHIHGGELTFGAIDDTLRHSLTKMSHLHFVSTRDYARRIIQLGEEPWRVHVTGALSLDKLKTVPTVSARQMEERYAINLNPAPLLVTYHPVTREYEDAAWQTEALLAALEASALPVVFTIPNADTGGRVIASKIRAFADGHENARVVENFGPETYFSMMRYAAAMIGNSSSGIIEAASFRLPVVNIGSRQQGRIRGENVIDVGYRRQEILDGIRQATSPEFKEGIRGIQNPYGEGSAAEMIVACLQSSDQNRELLEKRFYDLDAV